MDFSSPDKKTLNFDLFIFVDLVNGFEDFYFYFLFFFVFVGWEGKGEKRGGCLLVYLFLMCILSTLHIVHGVFV